LRETSQPPTVFTFRVRMSSRSMAPVPQPRSKTEQPSGTDWHTSSSGQTTLRRHAREALRRDFKLLGR
jgi:hypothetical protein